MDQLGQIRELQQKIRTLQEELITDELTRVLNRRGLFERIEPFVNEVSFQLKNPEQRKSFILKDFALIFSDIDKFKSINDTYGHAAGDAVLKAVATLLRENVRGSDIVGRYGGEEIVIGLLGANLEDARQIAENLREKLENHKIKYGSKELSVTASFGVASVSETTDTNALIDAADKALYLAKNNGRNRVEIAK